MSSPSSNNCLSNLEHVAKGSGYCLGASGTSLTMVAIAATATALALGLLALDGLFLYHRGVTQPLHLIWAIPVGILFVAFDCVLIARGGAAALGILSGIGHKTKELGNKMVFHFRQVSILPSN